MARERAALRGDENFCGFETGVDEICGSKTVAHVQGTYRRRRNPTSDLEVKVQVDEFLCASHLHTVHAMTPDLVTVARF